MAGQMCFAEESSASCRHKRASRERVLSEGEGATVIAASCSTNNHDRKRNPEMGSNKNGN